MLISLSLKIESVINKIIAIMNYLPKELTIKMISIMNTTNKYQILTCRENYQEDRL